MRSSSLFRFSSPSINTNSRQLSAKATVDTLSKLLDGKHINAFCSVLRDGYHHHQQNQESSSSSSSENLSSLPNSNQHHQHHQESKSSLISPFPASSGLNSSTALIESSMPFTNQYQKQMRLILRRSVHDALEIEKENELNLMKREVERMKKISPHLFSDEEVKFMLLIPGTNKEEENNNPSRFHLAKELFNAKRSTFLAEEEKKGSEKKKMTNNFSTTTAKNIINNNTIISPASWMVLANVAVSQGMWIRSLEIFDKLMLNHRLNIFDHQQQSQTTIHDEPEQHQSQQEITPMTKLYPRPPAPHTIAQTLRPGNIKIIRKWCRKNNAKMDIITGMKVLVEYSDDWAAALRLALEEERQPQSAPRGACESYSLGVLIPFLANGGKWTTASAVLADALARGSLVSDSLVQMILKSTAQQRTWVSCLALASSLSSCFAISPSCGMGSSNSNSMMSMMMGVNNNNSNDQISPSSSSSSSSSSSNENRELLNTLRAVAAVCRTWEQACSMISVCKRAGMKSGDEFIVGSAMEKLQRNGKWMEASQLIQIAVEDGTLKFDHEPKVDSSVGSDEDVMKMMMSNSNSSSSSSSSSSWMANLTKSNLEIMIAKKLIDSFRAECRWAGALKALSWMSKADSAATAAGLIATIEMCANAGEWKAAAEIGARVLFPSSTNNSSSSLSSSSLQRSSNSNHHHHHPQIAVKSESLYLTLIQVLSSAGKWKEAAHTFSEMVQDPTLTSISLINNNHDDHNHEKEENTTKNHNHNQQSNETTNISSSSSTNACDSVLHACNNNWEAALSFFEQALSWEPRILLAVSNYETVVRACLAAARWREAVAVLRLQRRNGVELALPQLRSGMWASALLVENGAKSDTETSKQQRQKEILTVVDDEKNSTLSPKSIPSWMACLRFYSLIPTYRRTAGDTQLLTNLASSSRIDAAAAMALKKALFVIAAATVTSGGGGSSGSGSAGAGVNRHHKNNNNRSSFMNNNNNNNNNSNRQNHGRGARR